MTLAKALVGLALLIPALAHASDRDVGMIKVRLDTGRSVAERSSSTSYDSVGLIVFGVPDTRTFDAPARRKIISIALSSFGDVVGYVLRKNGVPVCSFYGVTDGVCLSLAGCVSGTVCD